MYKKRGIIMLNQTSFATLSEEQLSEINGGYKMVSRGAVYMNKGTERDADAVISFIRGVIHG